MVLLVILSSISYGVGFKTYIVEDTEGGTEESSFLTFDIPHEKTGRQKLSFMIRQKEVKRNYYLKLAEDEEELQRCLKKITKNWKRNIAPDTNIESKWIIGYDEDEDKKFKRKLWFRLRRGEKIC